MLTLTSIKTNDNLRAHSDIRSRIVHTGSCPPFSIYWSLSPAHDINILSVSQTWESYSSVPNHKGELSCTAYLLCNDHLRPQLSLFYCNHNISEYFQPCL